MRKLLEGSPFTPEWRYDSIGEAKANISYPFFSCGKLPCSRSELLSLLQREIRRHDFSYFIENPPSIAQGGRGVCVPGCAACKVRINTMPQFLDHLVNDVLPKAIANLKAQSDQG
jgi:hypothetical protein